MPPVVRFRCLAVLLAGAYAVHTLRYALTYGIAADTQLLGEGHGYLEAAPIVLTMLLAAALGELVLRVARGRGRHEPQSSLGRVWGISATALLAIFVAQELAEGWLAAGHPAGLAAVVADGGWLAAPLAVAVGLLVALVHHGAATVVAAARRRAPRPRARPLGAVIAPLPEQLGVSCIPGPWLGGRGPPAFAG